jgi:hypothetical protein
MVAIAVGGVAGHVHLLLSLPSTVPIAKAVPLLKSGSSKWIHENFPQSRGFSWQQGYGPFRSAVPNRRRRWPILMLRPSITNGLARPRNSENFSWHTRSCHDSAVPLRPGVPWGKAPKKRNSRPRTASWAEFSRPYGTRYRDGRSDSRSLPNSFSILSGPTQDVP